MALISTRAYVLRTIGFGDTSRIAVLLGRETGKLRVVAKGYKNPKSGCRGALEPFQEIEAIVYHRPARDLQIISSADILHHHDGIESDATRYHYAYAVLELTDRVLPDEEPAPELYAAVQETLEAMRTLTGGPCALAFRGFQARVCAITGFLPELETCAVCDGDVQAERLFSASAGGFVCTSCARAGTLTERISPEAAALFRFLLRASPADAAATYSPVLRPAALEVAGVIERFLGHHLERYGGLRSMAALGRLMQANGVRRPRREDQPAGAAADRG